MTLINEVHNNCLQLECPHNRAETRLRLVHHLFVIEHLWYNLYQGVLFWFCGLASELELASSRAVQPANFPMHMYGRVLVPVTERSTSPYRCPLHFIFTASEKAVLEHFVRFGDGKRAHS
jgi:hypothetical protein